MASEHCDFCGTVAALRFRADPNVGGHLCPECIAAAGAADAANTGEAPATCDDCRSASND